MTQIDPKASPDQAEMGKKESLTTRAVVEMRRIAIVTLYLWVLFALFGVYKTVLLRESGTNVWNESFAIVNALIFAKVIVIGEALEVGHRLNRRALAWIVLGKAFMFSVLLLSFHVVEEAIRAWFKHLPLASSIDDFGGGTLLGVVTYLAIFFVALIPFFAFQEVARVLGAGPMRNLFFASDRKSFRLVEE
jgi:hypothetical protein